MKKQMRVTSFLTVSAVLLLCFNNCGQFDSQGASATVGAASSSSVTPGATATPTPTPTATPGATATPKPTATPISTAPPTPAATPVSTATPAPTATPIAITTGLPLLYVYEGAGCTGLAELPQFEAFVGRAVDGVVDFNDYTQTPPNALANLNWQLGCWQGHVPNIAISIGLAFNGMSTAQIAAGAMDTVYAKMGESLVSHGFANANIRLGWESNGGWYGWGQKGATYAAAFNRIAPILRATAGSKFTVIYNPAGGLEMNNELPNQEDGFALDEYANSWNSGGASTEPGLWNGNLNGWWGFDTLGSWKIKTPLALSIPEFGVGSRGDGHGACTLTGHGDCDDAYFMTNALAQAIKVGASFIGYWDYNAGDYNSRISDGSRPQEAAAFLNVFGSTGMKAVFAKGAATFTEQTSPMLTVSDCHAVAFQTAPSHWMVVVWATSDQSTATVTWSGTTTSAEVYDPNSATPATAVRSLGAANTATLSLTADKTLVIAVQQ